MADSQNLLLHALDERIDSAAVCIGVFDCLGAGADDFAHKVFFAQNFNPLAVVRVCFDSPRDVVDCDDPADLLERIALFKIFRKNDFVDIRTLAVECQQRLVDDSVLRLEKIVRANL